MREKIGKMFSGRQGMDELSKALFWCSLACMALSALTLGVLNGVLSSIFSFLGFSQIILCFIRAFSRRLGQREAENAAYLAWLSRQRSSLGHTRSAAVRAGHFKFFKCPGCGTYIRVPRGKGRRTSSANAAICSTVKPEPIL